MTYLNKYSNLSKNRTVQTYLKSVKSYFLNSVNSIYPIYYKYSLTTLLCSNHQTTHNHYNSYLIIQLHCTTLDFT